MHARKRCAAVRRSSLRNEKQMKRNVRLRRRAVSEGKRRLTNSAAFRAVKPLSWPPSSCRYSEQRLVLSRATASARSSTMTPSGRFETEESSRERSVDENQTTVAASSISELASIRRSAVVVADPNDGVKFSCAQSSAVLVYFHSSSRDGGKADALELCECVFATRRNQAGSPDCCLSNSRNAACKRFCFAISVTILSCGRARLRRGLPLLLFSQS